MKKITSFVALMALPFITMAQWPSTITAVESKSNDSVTVSGDLANGSLMQDLSWAANSTNACFVATQNFKYRGNHVLFATTMPPHSIMYITVTPTDSNGDLSIYGYMMGGNEYRIVPDLPSCITCEADYKWDRPVRNKVQTEERKIEFQNPTGNTYNIVIGVAAPKDVSTGQFNVKVKVKS